MTHHRDEVTAECDSELMDVRWNLPAREASASHLHVPTDRFQLLPSPAELYAFHRTVPQEVIRRSTVSQRVRRVTSRQLQRHRRVVHQPTKEIR